MRILFVVQDCMTGIFVCRNNYNNLSFRSPPYSRLLLDPTTDGIPSKYLQNRGRILAFSFVGRPSQTMQLCYGCDLRAFSSTVLESFVIGIA